MLGEMTTAWMFVALIETCVGSATALYGWRQKEPWSLTLGIALTLVPGFVHTAWITMLAGLGLLSLLFVAKRMLG